MPKLTSTGIRTYAPTTKRREIPDAHARGLYLILQPKPSGAKSWALRFRRPNGKAAKMTLGPVDLSDRETHDDPVLGAPLSLGQARELAARIDRKRKRGIDVIEEYKAAEARRKTAAADLSANTFGALVREFFTDYQTKRKARQRRWRDTASVLGLRYKPDANPATDEPEMSKGGLAEKWADKPVASIDGHDVHAVVSEAKKLNDGRARKMHAALSVFFGWLIRERRIASNPCAGVWRPGPPPPRERTLTNSEIVTFWRGCDKVGTPFGPLFKIMLLTGCRLREAANMTHSEIDKDGIWTVPGNRTKNGRPLSLTLPTLAREIIDDVPVIEGEAGYVFTTTGKTPVSGFSRAKALLDDAMLAELQKDDPKAKLSDWRLHDLRRTAATKLAELGVELPVIEKTLNHVSGSFGGIVSVYQKHEYKSEIADALKRWSTHLQGLIADRDNVIDMKRKRGAS